MKPSERIKCTWTSGYGPDKEYCAILDELWAAVFPCDGTVLAGRTASGDPVYTMNPRSVSETEQAAASDYASRFNQAAEQCERLRAQSSDGLREAIEKFSAALKSNPGDRMVSAAVWVHLDALLAAHPAPTSPSPSQEEPDTRTTYDPNLGPDTVVCELRGAKVTIGEIDVWAYRAGLVDELHSRIEAAAQVLREARRMKTKGISPAGDALEALGFDRDGNEVGNAAK
jgi:hypothetical protein